MDKCPSIIGQTVELKSPTGEIKTAKWKLTKAYSHKTLRWENYSFWAEINAGGIKVKFEPVAWREFRE
jgi:hypothetical protein